MLKRLILCKLIILVLVLMSLPVSQAQISTQSSNIKISTYRDDPFVAESYIGRLEASRLGRDENGFPSLTGKRVSIIAESKIYRRDSTGELKPFAWNPWPKEGRSNENGNFKFPDEARFPLHQVERDAEGKPILIDGLQLWTPRDLHLGHNTVFAAAQDSIDAAEFWAGRDIPWGVNNLLEIEGQGFIDFNAFYSPSARAIFFGVVPYRLPGETAVKMFETATSWEMAAHECGHALLDVLKPNADHTDFAGYRTWGESFGDQMALWASLRDSQRVRDVLAESNGNLYTSNSLTSLCEAFAALVGQGTGIRDAFHDKKVSDTSDEVHDRSEVFTGAVYKIFTLIYNDLRSRRGLGERAALTEAADIMGVFLTHCTDYMPENTMTIEDVARAYLKVDKELFGGRYQTMFADEFTRREIFDADSVTEWMAHEAAVPDIRLPKRASDRKADKMVQANRDKLCTEPEFGLKLQSVTRDRRFGQTIVRVQLTDGRGDDAALFDNHGVLTFRADGTLADYHSPLPTDDGSQVQIQMQAKTRALMNEAKRLGIDQRGVPLSIVRRSDGRLTMEAKVMRSEGFYCWIEAFTLEHPEGERREVITPTVPRKLSGLQPGGMQILTADDLNE